jgi:hypothetical protein
MWLLHPDVAKDGLHSSHGRIWAQCLRTAKTTQLENCRTAASACQNRVHDLHVRTVELSGNAYHFCKTVRLESVD